MPLHSHKQLWISDIRASYEREKTECELRTNRPILKVISKSFFGKMYDEMVSPVFTHSVSLNAFMQTWMWILQNLVFLWNSSEKMKPSYIRHHHSFRLRFIIRFLGCLCPNLFKSCNRVFAFNTNLRIQWQIQDFSWGRGRQLPKWVC